MTSPLAYILVSVVVLVVMAVLVLMLRGQGGQRRLTPLAGIAFACVIAGALFGENRWLGYGLMGVGVILAVVDIFRRRRSA